MIGLVVLAKVDLEVRVNNMRYRDYGELLEDQIAEMKMRLRAYREGQRANRARLAKQHGVKFVDPNKTKEEVIMTTKQFIYVLGGLLQLGYTEMHKSDHSIVVSGVDVPTREFMVSDDILEFVPEHGSIVRAVSQDYALEAVNLGLELIQNFPEHKKIIHKPNQLVAYQTKEEQYLVTLNGIVKTNPGDWIITGVNGEQYPCDPEIFKQLYDIVE